MEHFNERIDGGMWKMGMMEGDDAGSSGYGMLEVRNGRKTRRYTLFYCIVKIRDINSQFSHPRGWMLGEREKRERNENSIDKARRPAS
jgi:hypothetical protein